MRTQIRRVKCVGASMSIMQAVFLGMVLGWMPILVLFAYLLWREIGADQDARLRSLFSSHGLEFDDQPSCSDAPQSNPAAQ